MSTFPLRIGTPDGLLFEGDVERVVCRSISGDIAILARHCNFCTALGMGEASVVMADGNRRTAACIGGMLSVMNGTCRLLATTWEWKEDIDACNLFAYWHYSICTSHLQYTFSHHLHIPSPWLLFKGMHSPL